MTPAQLVAIDLAAINGFVWTVQRSYNYEGETLLGVYASEKAARDAAEIDHLSVDEGELSWTEQRAGFWVSYSGSGELWIDRTKLEVAPRKAKR